MTAYTKNMADTKHVTREELEQIVARKDALEAEISALVDVLNSPVCFFHTQGLSLIYRATLVYMGV